MQNPNVDRTLSYKWLTIGQLFPETEGFALAAQGKVIATKKYIKYIMKEDIRAENAYSSKKLSNI